MRRPAGIAAVLLTSLAVALTALAWFGPEFAKARVEAALSRRAGPVTIGALHLLPAWPPTVLLERVTSERFGTVGRMRAVLSATSLMEGRRGLPPRLVIQDAVLTVPVAAGAGDVVVRGNAQRIDGAEQADLTLTPPAFAAAAGLSPVHVMLRGAATDPVRHVTFTGALRGEAFVGTAELPRDLAPDLLPADLAVTLAGAQLVLRGTVSRSPVRFTGHVGLHAEDGTRVAGLLGVAIPSGAVTLDADVRADARADTATVTLHGLTIEAPPLAGMGEASWTLAPHPVLAARLALQRLDLDALAIRPTNGSPTPVPAQPAPSAAPPAPPKARVIPDLPLHLDRLAGLDADLHLSAAALRVRGADYRDAAAEISLHGGVLAVAPLVASLPDGARLDASLRLDGHVVPPTAAFALHAPAARLAVVLANLRVPPLADGPVALSIDLRGAGASTGSLAATLDGHASLRMGEGGIENRALDGVLAAAHLPAPPVAGTSKIHCFDLALDARHGQVAMTVLALDTDRARVDGGGTFNLGAETLDVMLHPLLRAGPGITVPLHVGGTFAQPKISIGGAGLLATLQALAPPAPAPAVPFSTSPGPGGADACAETPGGSAGVVRQKPPKLSDLLRQLR